MRFGPVPVMEAEGAILAHSVATPNGRLRKGGVLTRENVAELARAGLSEVVVAQLDPGDIDENAAATRLASALVGQAQGVTATTAFTGRVNIVAESPGVARIDAAVIAEINACDPMITCATVQPFVRLGTGSLIATIKIISYGVAERDLARAERAAKQSKGAVGLFAAQLKTASLIVTQTDAAPVAEKGVEAMRSRLKALGISLDAVSHVAHEPDAISQALSAAAQDLILILTASATSDAYDVAPEGVRAAGGKITRFGMPVDPGNLLFLGTCNDRPVIGLPGCARSPALNGADFVLERIACGLDVTTDDIAAMGVGGLLKEIPQRPQPRRGPERIEPQ
ncbi:MAG: molybdopterin-binding protein [Pseudomonadota bacterium]